MKCLKCGGEMQEGLTVEYKVQGGNTINWNIPKHETWGNKLEKGFFNDSVDGEKNIKTYRCSSCGYLESYAP